MIGRGRRASRGAPQGDGESAIARRSHAVRTSSVRSRCAGQAAVAHTGPRSASSHSRHSTSSCRAAPPEKIEGHPAGRGVGGRELDGQQIEDPILVGRRDITCLERIDPLEAQGREPAPVLRPPFCAFSQSKRLTTTTTRFSAGRHRMSPTLTMESCTCADTTSRSSVSSATSFSMSMARPECPLIAPPASLHLSGEAHDGAQCSIGKLRISRGSCVLSGAVSATARPPRRAPAAARSASGRVTSTTAASTPSVAFTPMRSPMKP